MKGLNREFRGWSYYFEVKNQKEIDAINEYVRFKVYIKMARFKNRPLNIKETVTKLKLQS